MKRPFVSFPQDGPGHKTVTTVVGKQRLSIKCANNEQAKELAHGLIGLFKRVFPKADDKPRRPMGDMLAEESKHMVPHTYTPGLDLYDP